MNRPYIVCHMLTSLDGKIDGEFFDMSETAPALKFYGDLRGYYDCRATLYGRTTMLGGYADGLAPQFAQGTAPLLKEDFISSEGKVIGNFIVSVDPEGTLGFSSNVSERKGRPTAHIIEALTEQVSSEYLNYLQKMGVSYLFVGKDSINCKLLAEKLYSLFGINRLMVAGGGTVNWSFLREGLIDELSLVIAPVADGNRTAVSIFERMDSVPFNKPIAFRLKEVKPMEGDTLWLRYTCK